jgi:DNA mismatch endonuclease (patch repair protein)
MVDRISVSARSRVMSAIRGKNTLPEILLRKALFARGFRYRIHVKNLPGSPDVVLPKWQAVILINGCFWHGHDCGHVKIPKQDFWIRKINNNKNRDLYNMYFLRNMGWRVCEVWECALRNRKVDDINKLADKISKWLIGSSKKITLQSKKKRKSQR